MNDPTWEPDPETCDICGEIMQLITDFDYECPFCGYTCNTEPDYDSMKGGPDYD